MFRFLEIYYTNFTYKTVQFSYAPHFLDFVRNDFALAISSEVEKAGCYLRLD